MVIIIKGKPATTKLDGFVQLLKKGRGPKKSSNLVVHGFQNLHHQIIWRRALVQRLTSLSGES